MRYERYETYVGDKVGNQDTGGVRFYDYTGSKIVSLENLPNNISLFQFIKLFLKYPLDFIGMYVRSTINYMTPIYSEIYVNDIWKDKSFNILLNAIIWIIAFGTLIFQPKEKVREWFKNFKFSVPIFCFIFPCLMIIPGAPETRFFLPAYFLLYGFVCYKINYKELFSLLKKYKYSLTIMFFAILFTWISVIGSTLGNTGQPEDAILISGIEQNFGAPDLVSADFKVSSKENKIIIENNYDYGDYNYAWYIYCNEEAIDKIMYSDNNTLEYEFKEDGKYSIKSFIKNTKDSEDKQSIIVCTVDVNNGKTKVSKGM